jgi:hypothetical protein
VIVVVVIASMLILVIYRYYSFGVRVSRKGTAHLEIIRSASSILRNMQSDLQKYSTVDTQGNNWRSILHKTVFLTLKPFRDSSSASADVIKLNSDCFLFFQPGKRRNSHAYSFRKQCTKREQGLADAMITNFER